MFLSLPPQSEQLKRCSACSGDKPISDFGPNKRMRDGLDHYCRECRVLYQRNRYRKDANVRQKILDYHKRRRVEEPELYRGRYRTWRAANPEKAAVADANWRKNNLERAKQKAKRTAKAWKAENRPAANENSRARTASKLSATPAWADKVAMREFYLLAARLTIETGIVHEVDHIVPLKSKVVCGLHCQFNLQVITKAANMAKGNRIWPNMP